MTRTALPVTEAAAKLGITASALRKRFRRGAADGFKDDAGRLHIYLKPDKTPPTKAVPRKNAAKKAAKKAPRVDGAVGAPVGKPDKATGNGHDRDQGPGSAPHVTFILAKIEAQVDELARALANVTGHVKTVTKAVEAHDDLLAQWAPADTGGSDAMGRLDLFEVRLGELSEAQAAQEHMLTLLTHRIEGLAKLVTRAAANATEPGFLKRLDEGLAELAGNVQELNLSLVYRDQELDRLKRLIDGSAPAPPVASPRLQPQTEPRTTPESAMRPLRPGPPRPFGKKAPPGGGTS